MKRPFIWLVCALAAQLCLSACGNDNSQRVDEAQASGTVAERSRTEALAHGEMLARIGGCVACHRAAEPTDRGQRALGGGMPMHTEYGTFYPPNISPHPTAGIGQWSANDFWRAMHHGQSPSGRHYYPAFPYPWFTRLARDDVDAIYAWLMTQPVSAIANRAHTLKWPYRHRRLLTAWRWLYFEDGEFVADPQQSEAWNRGAYLVQGIAHCDACHRQRGWLGGPGGPGSQAAGAFVAFDNQAWYAPSLRASSEAGVQDWPNDHIQSLLQTGTSPSGSAMGPMADYVYHASRYLTDDDARAMAEYLRTLPDAGAKTQALAPVRGVPTRQISTLMQSGERVYAEHCAACHGERGEGTPRGRALAGNRAVTLATPNNVLHSVQHGGYLPGTPGNPRPNGMPPYAHVLSAEETAAVVTYIRRSWGHAGSPLSPRDAEDGLTVDTLR